jgi:hypothetical protein
MPSANWLVRLTRGFPNSPALVEAPSGRKFRIKHIDAKVVGALRRARPASALSLLFSLLVESEAGLSLRTSRIPLDDRRHLLSALIDGNASIYGIATVDDATESATNLEDKALAFVDAYLSVEEMVSAQILTATRSSTA